MRTIKTQTTKVLWVVVAAAMWAGVTSAQEVPKPDERIQKGSTWDSPEFGEIREIVDKTRVYVIINGNLEARSIIVKELAKDPTLTVVSRKEDCDFLITMTWTNETTGASVLGSSVMRNTRTVAQYMVLTRGPIDEEGLRHQRIVWSTTKRQEWTSGISFNRHPAINGTREFLEALAKARKETK